ncbi:hypothetical protein A4S06_06295 [Erysipelotrichaceae bacterium MTC7]|nr:hypothetical protein A4S06_06295 [Erysipelotrichaceae bacterium MTC7]
MRITQMAKKEITKSKAKEYRSAKKKRKGEILDAVCETTGWSRDNCRRQLKRASRRSVKTSTKRNRTKPLKYSFEARLILFNLWCISGQCCGQYMVYQIEDGLIERVIAHKELHRFKGNKGPYIEAGDPIVAELKSMSSATIDRYLAAYKKELMPLSKTTTKPASYPLRNEIPFGKSYTEHQEPGWLSTDTVAHCGANLRGDHIWTLNSTDTVTGWTETLSIKSRASIFVKEGHEEILPRFPFPVLGINYDGGSEFINREMIDYAKLQDYQMTRSRPYHSNDNAHIEQKNGEIVRRYAFRYRYNGDTAMAVLNDLWYWVNIRKNYLLPTRKCIGHTKTKSGRTRGIYDRPMSPARRLLNYDCVSEDDKQEICQMLCDLNDAEVTRQILDLQSKLIGLASARQLLDYVNHEVQQVISA